MTDRRFPQTYAADAVDPPAVTVTLCRNLRTLDRVHAWNRRGEPDLAGTVTAVDPRQFTVAWDDGTVTTALKRGYMKVER